VDVGPRRRRPGDQLRVPRPQPRGLGSGREWEGVPAASARAAAEHAALRPGARALEVSQDRLHEKQLFERLGIDVAAFAAIDGGPLDGGPVDGGPVDHAAGLAAAIDTVGLPAVLKTRRGGYDGQGQAVVRDVASAEAAYVELGAAPGGLILEGLVPFDREVSVLAARGLDGTTRCWPVVENVHVRGILRVSRAPAPGLDARLQGRAEELAGRILDELGYVGVLAVELFELDGRLLANELAPRVHNTGHWTIEGAATSQFTQHLRAILGMPLGPTTVDRPAVMVNCIGTMPDAGAVGRVAGAHLHDYAKSPRPGRKLGHVTVVADSPAELEHRLAELARAGLDIPGHPS
jgi:5-(carboxyamino)imidazole ribonucleotide synthase